MKKLLFFGLLSLSTITGCTKQIYYAIGTPETEFKAHTKGHLTLVEQTEHSATYKKYYTFMGQASNDDDGMYYYFADGKLVRMDRTGPNVNVIIQHNSN